VPNAADSCIILMRGERMKKKRVPFNEQVLRKIAAEREKRWKRRMLWIQGSLMFLLVASQIGVQGYLSYLRNHPRPSNVVVANSAPQMTIISVTKDGIPDRLNINGELWTVTRVKDFSGDPSGETTEAQISCETRGIWYLPTDSHSELRRNVIHEVFHAGACLHGGDTWWNSINPDRQHHDGIYHLGNFWSQFAAANPEFMEWIAH